MKTRLVAVLELVALAFWVALGSLRLLDAWQNARIIPALLAAQSGLVAWRLVTRRHQAATTPWPQKALAWASALLPLGLCIRQETLAGQFLTGLGLLLVLWAMAALGRSFGIAPADRGLVRDGPYRFLRHPMYLGELVSLAGAAAGSPSAWNIALLAILVLSLLLRIRWEERAVLDYAAYAGSVRWRLIPHIW